MTMNPVLLGYFPKQLVHPPEQLSALGVEEIASVSLCIAGGPEGWQQAWKHNEWGFFGSPEVAWSLVPSGSRPHFRLYAYALYPAEYLAGREEPLALSAPEAAALGTGFELVGLDVVSRSTASHFECSPLSCNMLAKEIQTNRYGLLEDLVVARSLARSADEKRCEPGPYHVVEVWRKPDGSGRA